MNVVYTRDMLPHSGWAEYRKTATTRAVRITGPFAVETKEGRMTCQDGYLALDSEGDPYPIAASVFNRTYTRAE